MKKEKKYRVVSPFGHIAAAGVSYEEADKAYYKVKCMEPPVAWRIEEI